MAEYKLVNATQLDKDLKDICDLIRNYPDSGYTSAEKFSFPDGMKLEIPMAMMNIADTNYALGLSEGTSVGYNDGYNKGIADGEVVGKQSEYDRFWDTFQKKGARTGYGYAFYLWYEENYNPKYPIVIGLNSVQTFRGSNLTDTKVDITVDATTQQMFYQCGELKTIKKIISTENATYPNAFVGCSSLENLVMEGIIASSLNISGAPKLSRASIESIFSCLSNTTTELTAIFSTTAKDTAFTTEEWDELVATKPNWTIALA